MALNLRINLYRMFYSIDQVFGEDRTYYEEFILSLLDHRYSCHSFILVVFFAYIYPTQSSFHFFIHILSCVALNMYYCSDRNYYSKFI